MGGKQLMGSGRRQRSLGWGRRAGRLVVLGFVLFHAGSARALSTDEAIEQAEAAITQVNRRLPEVVASQGPARPTPEQRFAAGELLLRQKSYERAIETFHQILELYRQGKTTAPIHADALFLLADAYFRSDQLLAARREYLELVERGTDPSYEGYAGRSLGRLVDIALRTERFDELQQVIVEVDRLAARKPTRDLVYAKGKALFALDRYAEAERLFATIPEGSRFYPQTQYILGVIYTNQALAEPPVLPTEEEAALVPETSRKFARAILRFQKVTQLEVDNRDHQHVVDLAWMALGRLFYETDDQLDAADAYLRVSRDSPEFPTMLFELSWVYIRLKDFEQAERGLEVLSIASPDKMSLVDGTLLRADLMLRSKQFEGALAAYRAVRDRFEPLQDQLDAFVQETTEPAQFYDRLVEDRMGVRTRGALPPLVMEWLREESEDERMFGLIDDVTSSREMVRQSRRMIRQMNAVLESGVRSRGFPDLDAKLKGVVGLLNQLTFARRDLVLGLEATNDSTFHGELGMVRASRRDLMERLRWLPTTPRDIMRREASGLKRWSEVSQKLQRLQLESDKLRAIANGLGRLLRESERYGLTLDRGTLARVRSELSATEEELARYEANIRIYREAIERGRIQIGFGDARYKKDEQVRLQFGQLTAREFQLARAGQAGADASEYAERARLVLERLDTLEQKLETLRSGFQTELSEHVAEQVAQIRAEQELLEAHIQELEALDQHARQLVGEVAQKNFALVQERLRNIVLRSDVGIAQQAWELRESNLERVQKLQRERAREERLLEEEWREVKFDGVPSSSEQPAEEPQP